jgi:N-methylhydantoinase B
VPLEAGDSITIKAGGGGGYGDALERDPAAVLEDVRQDYVTPAHAAEVYGVVIRDGAIDDAASTALRERMRTGRAKS